MLSFYESLISNLAPNAWWINNKETATRANLKLLQLKSAVQCGFSIPKTICSNFPEDIRTFVSKNNRVIYKPFYSNFWVENNNMKISYTKRITEKMLPVD